MLLRLGDKGDGAVVTGQSMVATGPNVVAMGQGVVAMGLVSDRSGNDSPGATSLININVSIVNKISYQETCI